MATGVREWPQNDPGMIPEWSLNATPPTGAAAEDATPPLEQLQWVVPSELEDTCWDSPLVQVMALAIHTPYGWANQMN